MSGHSAFVDRGKTVPHLFVALSVTAETRNLLANWCERLTEADKKRPESYFTFQKWVDPRDYHITLKFLGQVDKQNTAAVCDKLAAVAREAGPFHLTVNGLDTFGPSHAPNILYAKVGGELRTLAVLQTNVERSLLDLGFAADKRSYTPHITLAKKYRGHAPWPEGLLTGPALPTGEMTVRDIVLYQTHIGRLPMYEPLHVYSLGT
jgi:RNA 2',3'-cyclic 3'-phosphodiesterase